MVDKLTVNISSGSSWGKCITCQSLYIWGDNRTSNWNFIMHWYIEWYSTTWLWWKVSGTNWAAKDLNYSRKSRKEAYSWQEVIFMGEWDNKKGHGGKSKIATRGHCVEVFGAKSNSNHFVLVMRSEKVTMCLECYKIHVLDMGITVQPKPNLDLNSIFCHFCCILHLTRSFFILLWCCSVVEILSITLQHMKCIMKANIPSTG